jgi:hypothetical protein
MSYAPVAFIAPNYRDYGGWWLKSYQPSSTTAIAMATDSTGSTLAAKFQLDEDGFITSDGNALVIPFIDQPYDSYLFPTAEDADNNDTANAVRVADNQTPLNSNFDGFTDLVFDSVYDMQAGIAIGGESVEIAEGNILSSSLTKWRVVSYASYNSTVSNRTREFNTLPLDNGLYARPISTVHASDFMDDSVTANNDDAAGLMSFIAFDGIEYDFDAKMFRVFANTPGIPSSTADPLTDRAQDLNKMMYLDDIHFPTFKNGGLYAADQGVAPVKSYYPSTLYCKQCKDIIFGEGSLFESKGESWGDSDAAAPLSTDDRQDFVGQNGGHAIALVRCDGATGYISGRLAGSAAVIYAPSTTGVNAVTRANAASLGYAGYNADGWCGDAPALGVKGGRFTHQIINPDFRAEDLFRREDNVAVGSSIYSCKAGILIEDSCDIVGEGGFFSDMYANGADKWLGCAVSVGGPSTFNWQGGVIRRCQEVMMINAGPSTGVCVCNWHDVDAETELSGIVAPPASFGDAEVFMSGKIRIELARFWTGVTELVNTTLIANGRVSSSLKVTLDMDAAPIEIPVNGGEPSIFSLINNETRASYGGVRLVGGKYVTTGYLIRSVGWGSPAANSREGLVVSDGVILKDISTAALDAYIQYANQDSQNIFTYIYHDLEGAKISSAGFRPLNTGYAISGVGLDELTLFPRRLGDTVYTTNLLDRPLETVTLENSDAGILSGADTRMNFVCTDGRPVRIGSYIASNVGISRIKGIFSTTVSGPLRTELLIEGDVRNNFTQFSNYAVIGG